jgi:hypothetical protein
MFFAGKKAYLKRQLSYEDLPEVAEEEAEESKASGMQQAP